MSEDKFSGLSSEEVQQLVKAAGINRPVMSVRVVGNRVELHQLGGAVALVSPASLQGYENHKRATTTTGNVPNSHTPADPLKGLTVRQLHNVAAELGLTGYTRLSKADLLTRLQTNFTAAQLSEVIHS